MNKGPKKVGKYQLGDQIGKGAVGQVFRGLDLENGTMVAVKQIIKSHLKNEQMKAILGEIELLKRLNHENIVKYIDFIQTEHHLNIMLEFVEVGSFDKIIRTMGPIQEELLAYYVKQILTGLEYLHSQGIVHRDIKGGNLLYTKRGKVKLADFGVSATLTEGSNDNTAVGSPYWMAPEIIEMKGQVSPACDIWSLGCTVIELLTGHPPYHDLDKYCALMTIVSDNHPPLPDGVSEDCKEFLLRCFVKEPDKRADVRELLSHRWVTSHNTNVCRQLKESFAASVHENLTLKESTRSLVQSKNIKPGDLMKQVAKSKLRPKYLAEPEHTNGSNTNLAVSELVIPTNCLETPAKKANKKQGLEVALEQSELSSSHRDDTMRKDGSLHTFESPEYINSMNFLDQVVEINFDLDKPGIGSKAFNAQNEIQDSFNKLSQSLMQDSYLEKEQIQALVCSILENLREKPVLKRLIMDHQDISIIAEIIEEYQYIDPLVSHACLEFFNFMIEGSPDITQRLLGFGIVPLIGRFIDDEEERVVMIEAAYFFGIVSSSTSENIKQLVSCGGLQQILKAIELTPTNESMDIIEVGVDCLRIMLDKGILEIFHIQQLVKSFVIEQLLSLIDCAKTSKPEMAFNCLDCLNHIAGTANSRIRRRFAEPSISNLLLIYLKRYESHSQKLKKIVGIFKSILSEPSVQTRLEVTTLVPLMVKLLFVISRESSDVHQEIVTSLLTCLSLATKMNSDKQDVLVKCHCVPLLFDIAGKQNQGQQRLAMSMICDLANASDHSRDVLVSEGIREFIITKLKSKQHILDLLNLFNSWAAVSREILERELLTEGICKQIFSNILAESIPNQTFANSLSLIHKLVVASPTMARSLSGDTDILDRLLQRCDVDSPATESFAIRDTLAIIETMASIDAGVLRSGDIYGRLVDMSHSHSDKVVICQMIDNVLLYADAC